MIIEKGTINDIDELAELYDDLNDFFESSVNYPGWIKGIYPVRETAVEGIEDDSLFVLRVDGCIAGSIILNHKPEEAYRGVKWSFDSDYSDVFVIHTLVVHPRFLKRGIGDELMKFAEEYGRNEGMRSIRLDVSIDNTPAIALYEKHNYTYIDTVDLGLNYPHLIWFRLYEKIL